MTIGTKLPMFVVVALMSAFASPSPAPAARDQKQQPDNASKKGGDSMTGCVDERDGQYVLTNDSDLALMANLQADGFPTEAFAKHLGHKVTVRGTAIPGASQPTFKVRSVTAISDTCAPQRQIE